MTGTGHLTPAAAQRFADRYADASSEKQLGQSFWRDFFTDVCGITDLLASGVEFEFPVRSSVTHSVGFVDVLIPGVLLVEHKSAGHDLDKAEKQARDYLAWLTPAQRPPVVIVCDFQRWRVIELLAGTSMEFPLAELPLHLDRIASILEQHGVGAAHVEATADARAAGLMSELFVAFEDAGYRGHEVSVFLVRVLFLLFGDDTGIWRRQGDRGLFANLVEASPEDGAGLGGSIQELFQVLNQPREQRPSSLPPSLADFPYVNGGLFAETLPIFSFTREMRAALVEASRYDWSAINPSIFGAMFQNIKSREARRRLGEHFTSEQNIMKVLAPLFLTSFHERLRKNWDNASELRRFRADLGTYTWADPACGCGNFLLVAYKRVRELELRLVARTLELEGQKGVALDATWGLSVRLSQFHGIELEEWSSQIAGVAMFLAEHQANVAMERVVGGSPDLLPLSDAAHITHGNALELDWAKSFPISDTTFIMGNPPFYGARLMSPEQKAETLAIWGRKPGVGELDYVTNWYLVAARHIADTGARAAFVSTNSITQGAQPPVMWPPLLKLGIGIDFAHRTFRWSNDALGQAAVHTVIIGFSAATKPKVRPLWSYPTPTSEPELEMVTNINPYLSEGPTVLVASRTTPLSPTVQPLVYGSQPNDDGVLSSISPEEAEDIRRTDPLASKYLRRLIGARELIHGAERWCLWLPDADPTDLRNSPVLAKRLSEVKDYRLKSSRSATRDLAKTPYLFGFISHPKSRYLAVPRHSSEGREYLPVAMMEPDVIASDALSIITDASLTTFGFLVSRVFWLWAGAVSGRIKSDIRISAGTTYNNFPFPELATGQKARLEAAAADVLTARSHFLTSSLADLYDPRTMPQQLRRAHAALDREVLASFGLKATATDAAVLAKLFRLYDAAVKGPLLTTKKRQPKSPPV